MKRIITLMTLVLAAICAKAENYPHRSDYLWTAIPDHADWLYTTGQKARIEVTLLKYGIFNRRNIQNCLLRREYSENFK